WAEMAGNRRAGADWAAVTLLAKPGLPPHLTQAYAEEVFWLAIDPGTYRSLTLGRGLSPAADGTGTGTTSAKLLLAGRGGGGVGRGEGGGGGGGGAGWAGGGAG